MRLVNKHEDTFLLHQLSEDRSIAHAFDMGQFFNRQASGFKIRSLEFDDHLSKILSPIATFEGSALAENDKFFMTESKANREYVDKDEFVAIAEGIDVPLYIFTYNIEMTQFVYTDLLSNPSQ